MIDRFLRPLLGREETTPVQLPVGVAVLRGRWLPMVGGWLSGMRRPAAAVTLGRTIVVHPDATADPRLLAHELAHVQQWQKQPLLFPLEYLMQHIRCGYWNNPFEIEAREAESQPAAPHPGNRGWVPAEEER